MKLRHLALLLCTALLTLALSCTNETEQYIDDNTTQETLELRALYAKNVEGSWIYVRENETTYIAERYTFDSDGSMKGHILVKTRHRATVNGESVLTDWDIFMDDDFQGKWALKHDSSARKNVMTFSSNPSAGLSPAVDFIGADGEYLEIMSPLISSKIIKMSRAD